MATKKRKSAPRSDTKPHARTLFDLAVQFTAAADAYVRAYGTRDIGYVRTFLLCRALELAFKAALRANGMSPATLAKRPFGHDLVALIDECSRRSIQIIDPDVPDTKWGMNYLNKAYSKKELEYMELGAYSGPTPVLLRRVVHFALRTAGELALTPNAFASNSVGDEGPPGLSLSVLALYEQE